MKNIIIVLVTAAVLAGISSCVKEKFTTPANTNTDPNLTPNTTIAALKALYTNAPVQITNNLILEAVVVGDDQSGNLYKQLAIEDTTGGIMLMINGSDLYTSYPVGRRLFIQLQGLYIVQYDGTYEIVGSVNGTTYTGLSTINLSQYVVPGKWGINIAPITVTVTQLQNSANTYQSELLQLNGVEFITGERGVPYANAAFQLSGSLSVKDCNENQVTVYTSGYANFANSNTPQGNGTMICLGGVYNGTPQLTIRDTTDLSLTGNICP